MIYDEPLQLDKLRADLTYFPVPFQKLVTASCPEPKLHKLVKNMIYVGVAARILGVDMEEAKKAIAKQLKGKAKAVELNQNAAMAGYDWAMENLPDQDYIRVVRDNKTQGLIIVDGNEACALGAMFAGVTVVGWYPITPASSLVETFIEYAEEYRIDPKTGKSNVAIVQMEDELASAGVVLAAGWAGARSMTSTAGPGISLMSEFIGLGLLRRGPWRLLQRGPHGAQHRPAHPHPAVRRGDCAPSAAMATRCTSTSTRGTWRSASSSLTTPSIWPNASRPRSSW